MFQKPAMVRHEKYCLKNPARICRSCEFHGDMHEHPMAEMVAALETTGMVALRENAEGCPACVLAAIVQQKMNDPMLERLPNNETLMGVIGFNYKDEKEKFYAAIRESRPEDFWP